MLADLVAGGRFLFELPRALRRPFDLMEARGILRRLETRAASALALVRRAVYGVDTSPYRALLAAAAVGPLDEGWVRPGAAGVMAAQWRQAGLVGIRRAVPWVTRSGKMLHLHQEGRGGASVRDRAPV